MSRRLTARTAHEILNRVDKLAADSPALWGKFTVAEMVAHLGLAIDISLGECEVADKTNFFLRWLVVPLIVSSLAPAPKGKIRTAPEFLSANPEALDAERRRFRERLMAFVAVLDATPNHRTLHPAFGRLKLRTWSGLHWHHFDHHLRQFGV